jgi:hypothetical protein
MVPQLTNSELVALIENELSQLHAHHLRRAKKVAHGINAHLTDEDLLNPDNFPEIVSDPRYTYEDGLAAGVLAAKIALRSVLNGGS